MLDMNFAEFLFRNCLENNLRPLSALLWRQDAPEWGLLPLLLAALGAPIRDLSRISKQFRKLDFIHLSQTGWVAHRPSAQNEAISSWLHTPLSDLGDEGRSRAT